MLKSLALLAKIDNIGSSILTIFVILGVLFWRPIAKKIYIFTRRKKGVECYVCATKTHDFLVDRDFNTYCQKCGESVKNESWF